jgi:type I restriction enzyme S subunit
MESTVSDWHFNAETERSRDAEGQTPSAPPQLGDSAFKETEIGWIPAEWDAVPFIKAIKRKRISAGKIKKRDYQPQGDFPVIDQGQDFIGGYWDDPKAVYEGELPVVIFGDHTRIFKFVDFPFIRGADGVKVLIPNRKRFDPHFFYFACSNLDIQGRGYNRHYKYLKEKYLPLPPLPEQRRIAEALRTIQEAIAAQEDVIAAARELKRSLMERLFTYGPGPEPAPTKETEIGEIPEHWEAVNLDEVIAEGPQNGIYKSKDLYGSGTMILRIDDYDNEGQIVTRAENSVELSADEAEKYKLNPGDLLVNRVNSLSHLGKTALVGQLIAPMVFESNMMRFRVNSSVVMPKYVFYFLSTPTCRQQMRGRAKRAVAQSSINQGDVKSLVFPLPPLVEQQRIVHILDTVKGKITTEEQRKAALESVFQSALEELMSGQIRVNAEPQRGRDAEEVA